MKYTGLWLDSNSMIKIVLTPYSETTRYRYKISPISGRVSTGVWLKFSSNTQTLMWNHSSTRNQSFSLTICKKEEHDVQILKWICLRKLTYHSTSAVPFSSLTNSFGLRYHTCQGSPWFLTPSNRNLVTFLPLPQRWIYLGWVTYCIIGLYWILAKYVEVNLFSFIFYDHIVYIHFKRLPYFFLEDVVHHSQVGRVVIL